MRFRELSSRLSDALTGRFEPTMRLEVYDRFKERTGQGKVKVAEVLSDGARGQLKVLDPAMEPVLRPLFTEKRVAFTGAGFTGQDGFTRDGAVRTLAPYKKETLEHAISSELPTHNLVGLLVELNKGR